LEEIEFQESAHPFHDWNAKINAECYRPNGAARVLDNHGYLAALDNNYARTSFNFGPTLLSWMEKHDPETYQRVLVGDRESQENFGGHGGAIAQVYNHIVMPLANRRDKETQIIWGLRDFESRFGRKPESMWLAETAVDFETLELMAGHGLHYVILAPRQALAVRVLGDGMWQDATHGKLDPKRPYRVMLPNGGSIADFFYDGPISRAVAFEGLLHSGAGFSSRMMEGFAHNDLAQILPVATDGESYGHHHRHGEMALAYALRHVETHHQATITGFGEYLSRYPPQWEAQIAENSSWSCIHGIERWRSDCGCNGGANTGWNQQWRGPLRQSLDSIRDRLEEPFASFMRQYTDDPWAMRNDYISIILDRSTQNREAFLGTWCNKEGRTNREKILKAMEVQRNLLLMYTSCGWFFDEISGIETVQNLKYACRAMELAKDVFGIDCEGDFMRDLEKISSNIPALKNGRVIYENYVLSARVDHLRVGAHVGMMMALEPHKVIEAFYCYRCSVQQQQYVRRKGKGQLFFARLTIESGITLEASDMDFCALWNEPYDFRAWVRYHREDYEDIVSLVCAFPDEDEIVSSLDQNFGAPLRIPEFFKDQQKEIVNFSLAAAEEEISRIFQESHRRSRGLMKCLSEIHLSVPDILKDVAFYALSLEIIENLRQQNIDVQAIKNTVARAEKEGLHLDRERIAQASIEALQECLAALGDSGPYPELLTRCHSILEAVRHLPFPVELQTVQERFYLWHKAVRAGSGIMNERCMDMIKKTAIILQVATDA
jgi:hypothetical protein